MKVVLPIEERCIDCHLCEVACIVEHSESKDPLLAYFVEGLSFNEELSAFTPDPHEALEAGKPKPLNRTRVRSNGAGVSFSMMCRHCEEPLCVEACKNGSLYIAEDGRVLVHEDKCVGCWMCVMACPWGAISRNPTRGNVKGLERTAISHKCDLCPDREVPACVMACRTEALIYIEKEEIRNYEVRFSR